MKRISIISFFAIVSIPQQTLATDVAIPDVISNNVLSCPWYNHGYIKLPGYDTCLKFGGYLQGDVISDNLMKNEDHHFTDTAVYIESRLDFDSKTQIGILELSTFSRINYIWDQGANQGTFEAEKAAISLSGNAFDLSGGIQDSLYTGFTGYSGLNLAGANWSDNKTLQVTLKIPYGPLVFGFSFEDVFYKDEAFSKVYLDYEPYVKTGNDYAFVGAVEYLGDILDLKLSGAVLDVSQAQLNALRPAETASGYASVNVLDDRTHYNYAVNANTEIRLSEIFRFSLGAQMGAGAMGFTGLDTTNYKARTVSSNLFFNRPDLQFALLDNDVAEFRDALLNNAAAFSYTLMGGFKVHLLEDVFFTFDASYQAFDLAEDWVEVSGDGFSVGSSLIWQPINHLSMLFGVGYSKYNFDGSIIDGADGRVIIDNDSDNLKIGTRVKYIFAPEM